MKAICLASLMTVVLFAGATSSAHSSGGTNSANSEIASDTAAINSVASLRCLEIPPTTSDAWASSGCVVSACEGAGTIDVRGSYGRGSAGLRFSGLSFSGRGSGVSIAHHLSPWDPAARLAAPARADGP